ncbi:D-alanyl-lipoteichoic acid biosynthesis protein DltB [Clostridium botulinum]|uniref:Teichoic acid D-alanyltransferase n=1 Tax=Clostridium botulinum TaxID=1491 RepID=A0ABC8CZ75_CLOBO|nr:D-alanyl-lipoteichoic acid biosynthesis protein DltB [Clostridium botulinum]AVQ40592.1 D-alanyl-lipoteichoic acid biosynthesis protein DltB [Clostridium botulinum]MDU1323511.1 D-alanyl-lipoteichoic acid biosynthesis protein DltB [Clostridium botulinum]
MNPFGGLYFFYIMFILLVPAIILGIKEKSIKIYGMVVNVIFILLIFGNSFKQAIALSVFFIGELILVKSYSYIIRRFKQRWVLWIMIIISLLPLIIVKWGYLLINRHIGFLGVSYLTFKVIQMLIEIYDGLIKEVHLLEFTYFILFFPTISSGPIDRSRRFGKDINKIYKKEEYCEILREGIYKLFLGIGYKFIIGAVVYTYWVRKIPDAHSLLNTLSYMYAYSIYLFFDFAGYSLMAVGTSYILGVRTPDNFNLPFISKDIKEFWNRWHMSLSFWFRDFIYTRFVMASLKHKWFKSRFTASYIGYIITMTVMGIWHGTEKYYIIYGIYHGILIVATDYFQRKSSFYKKNKKKKWWNAVSTLVTVNLVCFGFLIFSGYLFK